MFKQLCAFVSKHKRGLLTAGGLALTVAGYLVSDASAKLDIKDLIEETMNEDGVEDDA